MNTEDISSIAGTLHLDLPRSMQDFLLALDSLPERIFREGDVLRTSEDIIKLNNRLRAAGYYHLPWLNHFFAIGSDPGDCIYYFDLSAASCPVFLADHDFDEVCDYEQLAQSPEDFVLYLHRMIADWERQDAAVP